MSSAYLSPDHLNLIQGLLIEFRGSVVDKERESDMARFLVKRVEDGFTAPSALRAALMVHLNIDRNAFNKISANGMTNKSGH